jgi:DNA-directed RNA polymerase subunit F
MAFKVFPDIIKKIKTLSQNEQEEIKNLFIELRPTYSLQKELVENILDICSRDEISVTKVINKKIKNILNAHGLPREEKITTIRNYLYCCRFPLLAKAEEIFKNKLKSLKLPLGCKLIHPNYWEDKKYKLELNFNNCNEASKKLKQIFKISQKRRWQELINEQWFKDLFT